MEIYKWIASSCSVAMMTLVVWRFLNWVWFQPKRLERCLRRQGIKGTPYKLLFGDTKEMKQLTKEANQNPINISDDIIPRVLPFVRRATNTHGNIFFAWFGPRPVVHVIDPGLAKNVLSRINDFQKAKGNNPYVKLLSQGLVDYEGEKWSKHRKIINPVFHAQKLKYMAPAINLSCNEMINNWMSLLSDEKSCELDVFPHLQTFTSDVISRTAFGSNYEEGRRIFELQKELIMLLMKIMPSLYIPGSRFLPTTSNKRIKEIDHELRSSITNIINKRLMAMERGEINHDDLLGILLESNQNEIQQHGKNEYGMSIEDVIKECKLFYNAGQETTSNLLVWSMILLGKHPSWQAQARDEVYQVFGNNKPNFDGLSHLKYVTMILHEVLRLYPAVAALFRLTKEETKLGDLTLPAGTVITLPVLVLHRDHEIWGHDSNEFKPERFAQGVSNATKGEVSYFPFGGGPRICIGQQFALTEAKIALAMILQHFSFVLSPSYAHAPRSAFTLRPQYGAHLIIQKFHH